MTDIEKTEKYISDKLFTIGRVKKDLHFNRSVIEMAGVGLTIPFDLIEQLSKIPLLDKYKKDNERIFKYYDIAVEKCKQDPNSRQLLLLNTQDYEKEFQCFQLMQFINIDNQFLCLVYQRSCDMTKLMQDWSFFCHLAKAFETDTGIKIMQITIHYGSLHAKIDDNKTYVDGIR
jgi:hypothetical protein